MKWVKSMGKKVFLLQDIADAGKKYLTDRGYQVEIGSKTDDATIVKEAQGAEALIVRTYACDKEIIDALPDVKIIARHGVGYDNIDIKEAARVHKWVTNTPLANADSVAETTIMMILATAKNLSNNIEQTKLGHYDYRNTHQGLDIEGLTLGIIGYGKIGKKVAEKISGFGMNVLIYDPITKNSEFGEVTSREELIKQSDFISLHLPANEKTNGSFGEKEFAAMKRTAYLINLARGSIVDESALINAIKNKQIAGAGLDVYSKEPLPLDNPLYSFNNVILTPHIGSNTTKTMDRMALHAAMEVDRVLSGGSPKWPVNHIE
ncbi:D-3-phosphoglycerate dehydrogenase [Secundilactobacillus collinoides DSM 20515 = JCM 1123]|uniref:D-3-phosphoglycerate dehydrogenase n=2 Tax=Secundilactobacillus collinoides TaxID=33960 RepID=A0A0R2BGY9_SECCO|nr:D-3-phosphoglycerate dehydrogenase [Secundilactobacillus collinoides DSM 20515 = JCM 1123]